MLYGHDIDAHGTTSLRDQVKAIISSEIRAGRWTAGDRLPSVREMAEMSGLSSSPITQALSELVKEGFLIRHVGRGTFLRSIKPDEKGRTGIIGIVYGGAHPGRKTSATEALDRVGPRGHFLMDEHTMRYLRTGELIQPELFCRDSYDMWMSQGGKSVEQKAAEKALAILEKHEVEPLPEEVQRELASIVAAADRELAG